MRTRFPILIILPSFFLLLLSALPANAALWRCWCALPGKCASDEPGFHRGSPEFEAENETEADAACGSGKCPPPEYAPFTEHCPGRTVLVPPPPTAEEATPTEYIAPPPATGKYIPEEKEGGEEVKLVNPLGVTSIPGLVSRIISVALSLIGSLALLMFVYGGYTWLTSGGSADRIKHGRDIMVWATIGIILVFASYALVRFVLSAFSKNLG